MALTNLVKKCIRISQPIGDFYLGSMTAGEMISHVSILRRDMTPEARKNVQRKLNDSRCKEISEYVLSDPDATFPTSIIVSVYNDCVQISDDGTLVFEFEDSLGEVLDGQHRLEGLKMAAKLGNQDHIYSFELPVVFMPELDPDDKATVFSIINSKQTQVPSSLIYDLFGLQMSRSPQKTCHTIAQALNSKEGSPFYRGIKMLGTKNFSSEYLTQGAFAKYLLKLISKSPDEDARLEKAGKSLAPDSALPFRQFYIGKEDGVIAKILENYFLAISEVFPEEWSEQPKNFLLRKTAGYSALITVLNEIWRRKICITNDASKETFIGIALELKNGIGGKPITSDVFPSNEQGAKMLATQLLSGLS